MRDLQVGDNVCYARNFLLSTFGKTGDVWQWRGKVSELGQQFGGSRLVTVQWANGADGPDKVLECNLARVGTVKANG